MAVAVVVAREVMAKGGAEEAEEVAAEEAAIIVSTCKPFNVSIVGEKVTILLTAPHQERMTLRIPTWYPKWIYKYISIFFERHVDQEGKTYKEEG
jgi:hypothetical protein